jgi:hypothetical protein
LRDKSNESNDISTSGSFNRYLKKEENCEELKQTACFKQVESLTTQHSQNIRKNNIIKKSLTHIPKPVIKKQTYTSSPLKPHLALNTKSTHSRNPSQITYREDKLNKSPIFKSQRPLTNETNRLPSISTRSKSKRINYEINNILNIADQYREDRDLQNKINDLVKNIFDIKKFLGTKRNDL